MFSKILEETLNFGHSIRFSAPGDSMYPTICDGDLITVQPIKPSDIIVGDIILYRHGYGVVGHRVVNIQAPQSSACPVEFCAADPALCRDSTGVPSTQHLFFLRGDAAINDDFPVHADQILGKVVSLERNGRSLDPYCFRIKLLYEARRLAARLKRFLISPNSRPA